MAAIRGQHGNDLIDALQRHQLGVPSGMTLLSAWLAPTAAAGPSEEGGLEELVESFFRPASWRSRSAIRFSRSATLLFRLGDLSPKPFVLFSELRVLSLQLVPVEWAPLGTQPWPLRRPSFTRRILGCVLKVR